MTTQRTAAKTLSRSAFFDGIIRSLRRELPEDLQTFRTRQSGTILKVFYEDYRIHFEVWVDKRRNVVEIGLHLEDGPASTLAILAMLDSSILEIKHILGPHLEFGRWTLSWGHAVEFLGLQPLDADFRNLVASRLRLYVETLQPLIEQADISFTENQPGNAPRRKWSRGRPTMP